MNKGCLFCGNKNLSLKKVEYIYKNNGEYIMIQNVPALVCDYCGEQYFEGEVLKKIEDMFFDIKNNKKVAKKLINVPIEEYEEVI